ncbi:MAG: hypothetical protein O7G85_15175 [Planctomycetota bacterium]|nr:hypothetical protein [Planctomycetota bacterium]
MLKPASQPLTDRTGLKTNPFDRLGLWVGPLLVVALLIGMASMGGQIRSGIAFGAIWVLMTSLPWALFWMIGAIGLARPLRHLLAPNAAEGLAIQCGAGVGILLFLDHAMGVSGLLQAGGSIGAWTLVILGNAMAANQFRLWMLKTDRPSFIPPWSIWLACPAIALLILATCSAPGWLWDSEFGGYDALSYHLQLPKEWMSLGGIVGLDHNVYSHMPNFMEGAYYHLALLMGDGIDSVYAAQMLHALITIMTAFVTYRLASRLNSSMGGLLAWAIVIGTPWVIVTGSLAYNEMTVSLMLATGLLVLFSDDLESRHEAILIGLLMGAACGAKLTSIGLVALPLLILLLWKLPPKRWPFSLLIVGLVGTLVLAPYFLMNWSDTGNPVFPFLTSVFGTGHWTTEQATTWALGHQVHGGFAARGMGLVHEFLRYGIGANPDASEPWWPQWSILPWLSVIALGFGLYSQSRRQLTMKIIVILGVQITFWLLFTHVKSRFLLPAIVPLALSLSLFFPKATESDTKKSNPAMLKPLLYVMLLGWCVMPCFIFQKQRNGQPRVMIDWLDVLVGRQLIDEQDIMNSAQYSDSVYLNRVLDADAKILLIGHATPLYFDRPVIYQTTWDRGPLSRIMRDQGEHPADWFDALRIEGFTHLLVDPEMLRTWHTSGWNDPLITADRILQASDQYATIEWRFPNNRVLYKIEPLKNP